MAIEQKEVIESSQEEHDREVLSEQQTDQRAAAWRQDVQNLMVKHKLHSMFVLAGQPFREGGEDQQAVNVSVDVEGCSQCIRAALAVALGEMPPLELLELWRMLSPNLMTAILSDLTGRESAPRPQTSKVQ